MMVNLWTDGSGTATGGPGGWAFILQAVNPQTGEVVRERVESGPLEEATNQRAEMTALLFGLFALQRHTRLTVYSDSEYVLDGFRKGWIERWQGNGWRNREGDPVQNQDLWRALADHAGRHAITWEHVPGHKRTWRCVSCTYAGDNPPRRSERSPIRLCPVCTMHEGHEVRCEGTDKYPLNARCDKLAGQQRKRAIKTIELRQAGMTERRIAEILDKDHALVA